MKSSAALNFSLLCLLTWSPAAGRPAPKSLTPTPLNEWITYAPTTTPLNEWITYAPTTYTPSTTAPTSPPPDSSPTDGDWIVPSEAPAAKAAPLTPKEPKDGKVHEAHGQVAMTIFLVDMVLLFVILLIFLIWLYRTRLCTPYGYHDLPTEEIGNPLTRLYLEQ